ncbi:MAG: hypothetical protein WCT54_02125 [Patescibacteria group bacterium]
MPQVLAEIRSAKQIKPEDLKPISEIKADFMTLGGALILAITISVTPFLLFSLMLPAIDGLQLAIIAILTGACWLYLVNRFSEKLKLENEMLEFKAVLGRVQRFNLNEIATLRLTALGWSLSGDFFLLEVENHEGRPSQIGLGPCWRRSDLSAFIRTVGTTLEEFNGYEQVENEE